MDTGFFFYWFCLVFSRNSSNVRLPSPLLSKLSNSSLVNIEQNSSSQFTFQTIFSVVYFCFTNIPKKKQKIGKTPKIITVLNFSHQKIPSALPVLGSAWFKLSLIFCRKSSIAFKSIEEHNFQLEIFLIKLIIQLKNNHIIIKWSWTRISYYDSLIWLHGYDFHHLIFEAKYMDLEH